MNLFENYHAHIYFTPSELRIAEELVEKIRSQFNLPIGRIWNRPVGPHPIGSCQITVSREAFPEFIPWLMHERGDLDIFLHADTGDDWLDHTQYVAWLGKSHPLNLDMFTR